MKISLMGRVAPSPSTKSRGTGSTIQSQRQNRWLTVGLLVLAMMIYGQVAWAQDTAFNGYIEFESLDGTTTYTLTFEEALFGEESEGKWNRAIPYFYKMDSPDAQNGLWHMSCSEDLTGLKATVDPDWQTDTEDLVGITSGSPIPPFADGQVVVVVDWYLDRVGTGGGTCGTPPPPEPGDGLFDVSKTAVGNYDRTWNWTIDKNVSPASAEIFFGDSQDYDYTVDVALDETTPYEDGDWEVSGNITGTYSNQDVNFITVTQVADGFTGSSNVVITCGAESGPSPLVLANPVTLNPGDSIMCSYTADSDGTPGDNTATFTYTIGDEPAIETVDGTAGFDFAADPVEETYATVNVKDAFDGGDPTDEGSCTVDTEPCQFNYSESDLTCADFAEITASGDTGSKTNRAYIAEDTDLFSEETIQLTCVRPTVVKTADPTFKREYDWTIAKSYFGNNPVRVAEEQVFDIPYTLTVGPADPFFTDSMYAVSGTITVSNPATTIAATINSVSDMFDGDNGDVTVDCPDGDPVDGPWSIDAGGSLVCSYSGTGMFVDGELTNTATAVQQNYDRAADGTATANANTADLVDTETFDYSTPTTVIDDCVDVWDYFTIDMVPLDPEEVGTVCEDDDPAPPTSFDFMGKNPDGAWFTEGDTEIPLCELYVDNEGVLYPEDMMDPELASDEVLMLRIVNADCQFGCTLTQGYWKTHSIEGPAPYDDTWDGMEVEMFYTSGYSWLELFWTPPKGGNPYIQLAHQYMAAYLNVANGASTPAAVSDAMTNAEMAFGMCGPEVFDVKGKKKLTAKCGTYTASDLQGWATTLDQYNNGLIGPGHCDENPVSPE